MVRRLVYILLTVLTAILNCGDLKGMPRCAALTQTGVVRQITNYYAYGTFMGDVSKGYVIKTDRYTGKELDREAGLDLYDYGARQYDATVGLFTSMDPMCEQNPNVNPYLYCHANPVNRIDPDGMDDYYTSNGQFLFRDQKESDHIIIRNQLLNELKGLTGAEWINPDMPIENVVLSAEAYSNIFTNILEKEGFDISKLKNRSISIVKLKENIELRMKGEPMDY